MRRLALKFWNAALENWFIIFIVVVVIAFVALLIYAFSTKPYDVGDARIELRAYEQPLPMDYKGEKCWMISTGIHDSCRVKIKNVSGSNITVTAWLIKANVRGEVQWTEVLMPGDETDIDHSKSTYPNIMVTVK